MAVAGLPALLNSQSGQVRKEAATTIKASAGVRLALPSLMPARPAMSSRRLTREFQFGLQLGLDQIELPS